jgi:hypothetical protein
VHWSPTILRICRPISPESVTAVFRFRSGTEAGPAFRLRGQPRDIYVPRLHIDSIKVKTRKFK